MQNNLIEISIIIPHNKRLIDLKKCLNSINNQNFLPNVETIIIFDKKITNENRVKSFLIKKFNILNIKVIFNDQNRGASYSRNKGLSISFGMFIAFLDSDDEWHQDKLRIQLDFMKQKKINFSHTSYFRITNKDKLVIRSGNKNYSFFKIFFSCKIATPTVIFKHEIFKNLQFDEDLRYMEDIDYWIQCCKFSNLYGLNIPLTSVNVNDTTSYKNISTLHDHSKIVIQKYFKNKVLIFFFSFISLIKYILKILLRYIKLPKQKIF